MTSDGREINESQASGDLQYGQHIGQALRARRLSKQISLEAMADETRIRRAYLAAIEDFALDALPARPFTIGYIRAYANALGLDGEAAVERFKSDDPLREQGLRAPVGVGDRRDPRLVAIGFGGALILGAIVLWNIAQRAITSKEPTRVEVSYSEALTPSIQGAVKLAGPLPAPTESTTPAPYETPGLAAAMATQPESIAADPPPDALPAMYDVQGQIYGDAKSPIQFQARRSTSLVVRNPDGTVLFARQLSAGDLYGAPGTDGYKVEVVEGGAIQLFVDGSSRGATPVGQSAISALVARNP